MGFYISNFYSAYNLYVNDKLVASNGYVADNADDEIGEYRPQAVFFSLPSNEFDIIVQVSNFHYAVGGFWSNLVFEDSGSIGEFGVFKAAGVAFLFGACILASVYAIALSLLRRELRYYLYFGLFGLFGSVSLDTLNMNFFWRLLPCLSNDYIIILMQSTIVWAAFFLIAFTQRLFNTGRSAIVVKIIF